MARLRCGGWIASELVPAQFIMETRLGEIPMVNTIGSGGPAESAVGPPESGTNL